MVQDCQLTQSQTAHDSKRISHAKQRMYVCHFHHVHHVSLNPWRLARPHIESALRPQTARHLSIDFSVRTYYAQIFHRVPSTMSGAHLPNPLTPLAWLPPDTAFQFEIVRYVLVGCLAVSIMFLHIVYVPCCSPHLSSCRHGYGMS